jgi:oxygen-independent coproporphyrinogen III oxidase
MARTAAKPGLKNAVPCDAERLFIGMSAPIKSLYVHVPFCARKCAYCAFYSEASDGSTINRFVAALRRQFESLPDGFRPDTIFFGGGTPSLLPISQWQELLQCMERRNLLGASEFTVECNPATVSIDKARLLRDYGVNRVSLGVQSFDEALLDRLGRIHSRSMALKSFDILRRAGFDNINLDLMFAIPGQTMGAWRETLAEATALQSEHLACYEVIYEEDTPLFHQLQAGLVREDDDLACEMYEELVAHAAAAGYRQYEVANFARPRSPEDAADTPGYACLHNVNYWRGGSFHGLGPSATAYIDGVRSRHIANTQLYCEAIEQGKSPIEHTEQLAPLSRAGETAAFGLRMVSGWPFDRFKAVTGFDLQREWGEEISQLQEQGLGIVEPGRFRLSTRGLRFADSAAQLFLRI